MDLLLLRTLGTNPVICLTYGKTYGARPTEGDGSFAASVSLTESARLHGGKVSGSHVGPPDPSLISCLIVESAECAGKLTPY